MKLIGIIAFLAVIFVGCQKEEIRPCNSSTPMQLRSNDDDGLTDDSVVDDGDTNPDNDPDGSGIQDDGTGGRGSTRTLKPRP